MNLKLCCLDNVKEPHFSTSVEESKKLRASRGDGDERDEYRSALNEASDSRKKKKCEDEKATGNGKADYTRQFLHVLITSMVITRSEISWNCFLKANINNVL